MNLFTDVIESIKKRFNSVGITILFPKRTLSYIEKEEEKQFEIEQKI